MLDNRPQMKRVNLDDPAQLRKLIANGAIWQFPQYWQKAIDAINSGLIPVGECKNVPAQAMAAIKK